jgi:hypothetical protein
MQTIRINAIMLLLIMSGCANQSYFENVPVLGGVERFFEQEPKKKPGEPRTGEQIQPREDQPLPIAGDVVTVFDPTSNRETSVILDRFYRAASGRLCSYYFSTTADPTSNPDRLSCQDNNGRWTRIPLTVSSDPPLLR